VLRSSAFFADLFDLPWNLVKDQNSATAPISSSATTPLTLDEVIDIDLSTKDLQLFLGFMQVTARFQFMLHPFSYAIGLDQARMLLSLIDQYECEAMRSALYDRLSCLGSRHPWEILQIACSKDNLALGRDAICKLWYNLYDFVGSDRETAGWIGLSKLSDSWKAEFLRLLLPGLRGHDTILLMEIDSDTYGWSKKFNPEGYQEERDVNGKRKRL